MRKAYTNLEITKIDEEQQMVFGYATTPDVDKHGEIVSLEAVSRALADYLEFPTIREMHQPIAVGVTKLAEMKENGLYIGAKIVDKSAWEKVKEGVYRAFSIGGVVKQMVDNIITDIDLTEISLVDRPANAQAKILLFKSEDALNKQEIDDVYAKWSKLANMSVSELEAWQKNECSSKASLSDGPIKRALRLKKTAKASWGKTEVDMANRAISFISRMKGVEGGKPVSDGCPSKKVISLKNWGHNPEKKAGFEGQYTKMLGSYKYKMQ